MSAMATAQTMVTADRVAAHAAAGPKPTCVVAFLSGTPVCVFLDASVAIDTSGARPVLKAIVIQASSTDVFGENYVATAGQTALTLAHLPLAGSVRVVVNGLRYTQGVDYTIAGATVTFLKATGAADLLVFDYKF